MSNFATTCKLILIRVLVDCFRLVLEFVAVLLY